MKSFDFSHWEQLSAMQGVLFFAQSMEEMLFHYSHDSLKVPALNFRFLCVEIKNTIEKIEDEVVDRGNMRPLVEELKDSFQHDPIAQKLFGTNFDSLLYTKGADGEYSRNSNELYKDPSADGTIRRIRSAVEYLLAEMRLNDCYYAALKESLTELIKATAFGMAQQEQLYRLTGIFLTDLINNDYSQEYIYWVVNDVFYNRGHKIDDIDAALESFWSHFDFQEKKYTVLLPLKTAAFQKRLRFFQKLTVRENEEQLFGNSCRWIIEMPVSAKDQYTAKLRAAELISFFASLLQYNDHKGQSYHVDQAIVILRDEESGTEMRFEPRTPATPLRRGNALPDAENAEKIAEMVNHFRFSPRKLINVIELHSSALNSNEIGNQLLNLWTVIEVLVPTERKNSFSKIGQLCNNITTVLNAQYVSSLVTRLLTDLRQCVGDAVSVQLSGVGKGENDAEKLTALLVLPEYQAEKNALIGALTCYPLLRYRIEDYSTVFASRPKLKERLTAHRKRLTWHLMRIYRNRNMIVHDGSHFPYIDVIVQNLHHYTDTLINTIDLYGGKGYRSLNTIFTALQQKEYRHTLLLEEKGADGKPKAIGDDFAQVVLGFLND